MLKISGLYTSFNEHLAPEGSLQVAKNINIDSPHVAEPRKGLERVTTSGWNMATERTQFLGYWNDRLIATHDDSTDSTRSEFYHLNSGTWTFMGLLYGNDSFYTAEASGNLYITSARGIQKRDQFATPSEGTSGMPAGIGIEASVVSGTNNWLANGDSVAYRAIFLREDANENLLFGAPTGRTTITNSAGATRVASVRVDIAFGVRIGDFVRLYRSVAVSTGSPSDSLQQVAEFELTSTEINQGYVDFTDELDEALLGAELYTNVSQEGIENANRRAPSAQDIAVFRDSLFGANTRTRDSIILTLTDAAGLANDDTITLTPDSGSGGVTITAKATENLVSRHFQLYTSGTADENVRNTCKSLARVLSHNINGVTFNAYYLENETTGTSLGEILVENRTLEEDPFYVTASNPSPLLPSTIASSGTDTVSSSDTFGNGLYWSKPFEPEAFPLPNQTRVASKASEIQRIIPLDEALMIFKEDGLYRLTGYYPDFEIELIDASVRLVGKNTPAILNNEIYCLTDQGIVIINATGVRSVISTPIEETIREQLTTHYDNMYTYSFGVGREAARRYYLFHPETSADTKATRAYVYNIYTKAWSIHEIEATCGLSNENEFYLGDTNSEFVNQERATGTNRDYADYGFGTTITATADRTITLNSGTDNINEGDILFETSTRYAIITAVDTISSQVTVASNPGFTNTSVDILTAIPTEIKWLPNDYKLPHITKQVHTVTPLFKAGFAGTGYLDFSSDLEPSTESVELTGTALLGWGISGWGSSPWGDSQVNKPFRQWVPRSKQRCTWLTVGFRHTYGFTAWKLQGIRATYNTGSEKTGR